MFDHAIITCEHGGNSVPKEYARLFRGHRQALCSHRGWDPGALDLARALAGKLPPAPLFFSTTTRLLVDLNRSPTHPRVFSEYSDVLPPSQRELLLGKHYLPYRREVTSAVQEAIRGGRRVLHISAHTFTPVLDGETRETDVGLLLDRRRLNEAVFCDWLKDFILSGRRDVKVHRNKPYSGVSDGLTTTLRKQTPIDRYAGIEIEVNQKFVSSDRADWKALVARIADAVLKSLLKVTTGQWGAPPVEAPLGNH